ncbi:putative reverse transcriptase domain-containing protein [Tanacetum coccineum]
MQIRTENWIGTKKNRTGREPIAKQNKKVNREECDTKFAKPSIFGKPPLQPLKNQSVVRQPTAFKSKRPQLSKPWFASQFVEKNNSSKPDTPHSWPKVREYAFAKHHHMIALDSFRNSSKSVSTSTIKESIGSNDMVHNYYLEEARKNAQLQKDKIRRKNNHRKKSDKTGTGSVTESNGTLNDATPPVDPVEKEVVSPSMVDEIVAKEKKSPLVNSTGLGLPTKLNFRTLFTPGDNGIDVFVPVESIKAIRLFSFQFCFMEGLNTMLENGLWFIRNNPIILKKWHPYVNLLKEDVCTISVSVKLHGVPVTAFSEDGLSDIATKLGTPLMLDSYTSDMCMQSWGRSSYARVMIELRVDVELRDNIVAAMPKITRKDTILIDSGLAFLWFERSNEIDPRLCPFNKMMSFLSTVVSSRFPTTNNQLRNSSNIRQQATIHNGRGTVQPVQGRQSSFTAGTSGTRANISFPAQ